MAVYRKEYKRFNYMNYLLRLAASVLFVGFLANPDTRFTNHPSASISDHQSYVAPKTHAGAYDAITVPKAQVARSLSFRSEQSGTDRFSVSDAALIESKAVFKESGTRRSLHGKAMSADSGDDTDHERQLFRTNTEQFHTLFSQGPVPASDSSEYLKVSEQLGSKAELMNNENRIPVDVLVSGNVISFDAQNDNNNLYHRFDSRKDLRQFTIVADKLIIASPLRIPGSKLTVYARQIVFRDTDKQIPASIDVTPTSDWVSKNPADKVGGQLIPAGDGAEGHSAQSAIIYAHDLTAPGSVPRFLSRGGNGQAAGKGRNGDNGIRDLPQPNDRRWVGYPGQNPGMLQFPEGTVYVSLDASGVSGSGGSMLMPDDGEPAQPAGKPGEPGNGGKITTNLTEVTDLGDLRGGSPGTPGELMTGGSPGKPAHALWISHRPGPNNVVIKEYTATKGADAPAPQPQHTRGNDGNVEVNPQLKGPWLHPLALDASLNYAKDLYINGHFGEAQQFLNEQLATLNTDPDIDPAFVPQVTAQRLEMITLSQRLASNLDYFGHSAGWTPNLSLEVNLAAFRAEVQSAITIMFVKYWMDQRAADIQSRSLALNEEIGQLGARVRTNAVALQGLQQNLVSMRNQERALSGQMAQVERNIKLKETFLAMQAKTHVTDRSRATDWKGDLRSLGTICTVIPVYQPVLGAVGQGMIAISNFDSSQPLDSISGVVSVTDDLDDKAFEESRAQLDGLTKQLDLTSEESLRQRVKELQPVAEKLGTAVAKIKKATEQKQVSASEIDAELAKLKAADPVLDDLIAEIEELNAKRAVFHQLVIQAVEQLASLSSSIATDMVAMDAMGRERSSQLGVLRPEVTLFINNMDRSARETLLKYQYYLARSYEYRLVQPYQKRLKLDRLLDRFQVIVSDQKHGVKLEDAELQTLRTIYEGTLQEITLDVINAVNNDRRMREDVVLVDLTPDELADLNKVNVNATHLDLMKRGYISDGQENARLIKIEVAGIRLAGSKQLSVTPNTKISIEHSAVSKIRSNGKLFLFRHPVPMTWGANITGVGTEAKIKNQEPSPSEDSLLVALLRPSDPSVDPSKMMFFSRPSEWTEITLRKTVSPSNERTVVSELHLNVYYEFRDAPSDQVVLQLHSQGNAQPWVSIDGAGVGFTDLNGEAGGAGELFRIYSLGTVIKLSAPRHVGRYEFQEWKEDDEDGATLPRVPEIEVTMDRNKAVTPIYKVVETQ